MANILENTDTIGTLVGDAWTIMTSNPLLLLLLCGSLLSIGFSFLIQARHAIHG